MKKSVEMISLNSTQTEFSEEMNLDERLQRLQSDELKSIRAGASCPSKDCPRYTCLSMGCPNECVTRCDADYPECDFEIIDCRHLDDDDCRRMDPT